MPDMIFELMKGKSGRKKKGPWAHIATLTPPHTVSKGRGRHIGFKNTTTTGVSSPRNASNATQRVHASPIR